MKTGLLVVFLGFAVLPALAAGNADDVSIRQRVNDFFAGYLKVIDSPRAQGQADPAQAWLAANDSLTPQFKAAYRTLIADAYQLDSELGLDSDPILDAQDYPARPFLATHVKIDGAAARAEAVSDEWKDHALKVRLVKREGKWMIDGINKINEKKQR